ncbi:MFS transporter (plasmid) [Halorarum halophilum]|uniref:MFS transporter n=1 Tax=Halorarum halophilum TaxID=2743090 RepID=A0A7D5GEL2_9EURY|nr:MFS transporter [Halobaculum halophilum]QLG29852.1 MFS transporter [Halobaculum halophilum]
MAERWLAAWGLGSVALGGASLLVPLYIVELGANPFMLGILAASAAFISAPGALVLGNIADRTGKRRVFVLTSLTTVTVALILIPFLSSILLIIGLNALVWFAAAAAAPVLNLLVTIDVPEAEWQSRFALLNKYQGWGWSGGLILGVTWTTLLPRLVSPVLAQRTFFGVCAVCGGAATLASARLLPAESKISANRPNTRRVARHLTNVRQLTVRGATFPFMRGRFYWTTRSFQPAQLLDRLTQRLSLYFVAVILFFSGFSAFFAPLPIYLSGVGYGSGEIFVLYLVSSLGSAAFYVTAGNLVSRYDINLLQTGGLLLRAIALPAVALVGTALAASFTGLLVSAIIFVIIGLSWAIIAVTTATIVTRLAPAGTRGQVLGIYTALSALAGGVGSVLGGWLASKGYMIAFGVAGGLVFVGAILVISIRYVSTHSREPSLSTG